MIPPIDHYPVVTLGKPRTSGDDPQDDRVAEIARV